jgi:hypothetical protein
MEKKEIKFQKIITNIQYVANDGKIFTNEHDCKIYDSILLSENLPNFDLDFYFEIPNSFYKIQTKEDFINLLYHMTNSMFCGKKVLYINNKKENIDNFSFSPGWYGVSTNDYSINVYNKEYIINILVNLQEEINDKTQ